MSLYRDTSRAFDQRLRLVSAATELPPEIDALRVRMTEFTRHAGRPVIDKLAQAVIDGTTDDLDIMWACALAETAQTAPQHNDVVTAVRNRIHNRIREVYAAQAIPTYQAIAAKFDATAAKLTAAQALVDVEADAEAVIDRPEKERKGWREAAGHAAELSRLLPSLKAAAVLAAICEDAPDHDLPLAVECDPELHRRHLWAAWEIETTEAKAARTAANNSPFTTYEPVTHSRCGRWGAVLKLGAEIRAAKPDEFTEYRRPRPMEERTENTPGGPRKVLLDPEDADYQPKPGPETFTSPRVRTTIRTLA